MIFNSEWVDFLYVVLCFNNVILLHVHPLSQSWKSHVLVTVLCLNENATSSCKWLFIHDGSICSVFIMCYKSKLRNSNLNFLFFFPPFSVYNILSLSSPTLTFPCITLFIKPLSHSVSNSLSHLLCVCLSLPHSLCLSVCLYVYIYLCLSTGLEWCDIEWSWWETYLWRLSWNRIIGDTVSFTFA